MILSDNETKLDLLNNRAIAKTVVSIIRNSQESISIGVHGDWGAGKSSVLAMIEAELDSSDESLVSDWNENEEEGWNTTDDRSDLFPYVAVRFNSWQYQGFEDAKIALMSAIVVRLENSAKAYYKKHKIKGGFRKLKEISARVWENIDKLSIVKNAGKIGVSLVTGTAPLALFDIAAGHIRDVVTNKDKASELIGSIGELIKSEDSQESGYKEMEEFRKNYAELFQESHTEKLVVLIDDLDRCLPKPAIETLEAVRMFLSLDNSAFVIAADDLMIRYSVNEYFPRASQDQEETGTLGNFADKYLEKLIQVPLHIPRIGLSEAQLYIMLLMIESRIGESEELKKLVDVVIEKLHKPWALEQLTSEEIKTCLGDVYPSVINEIMIAKNIDRILAENTGGNPRNIKRFINMLLLRTDIAHNRGFTDEEIKMSVLAKMMLVEQYDYDFYKAIAEEIDENGICHAFDVVMKPEEETITEGGADREVITDTVTESTKATTGRKTKKTSAEKPIEKEPKVKNIQFLEYLRKDSVKKWMSIEPSLANIDLMPYFFACTEREDFFFESSDERIRELFSAVLAGRFAIAAKKKAIDKLSVDDAKSLFKKASQAVFKCNLSGDKIPPQVEGLQLLVEYRPELQESLGDFLLTLPLDSIGVWALGNWNSSIPKTSKARPKLKEFYKEIVEKNTDPFVRKSAQRAVSEEK